MTKPISLSMHKNTKHKRELQEFRGRAVRDIKAAVAPRNVAGYCLITWSNEGDINCGWATTKESKYPIESVPSMMQSYINSKIGEE